jgi:glycosyltransferase involved in cell wall biosynthesis
MRILLINHYAGSVRHGMEYRPYYLAREWINQGHSVTILAASTSHVRSVQPKVGTTRTAELIDGIQYVWFPAPKYQGNGVGRVMNMASFVAQLWRTANRIAEEFRPDIVVASSTYPMDIWPARRIATKGGARLVFEVHDLWPLSPIELGGMSKWHPFIQLVQWAEDYAYRHSDVVISMLPKAAEYMTSRGMRPSAFHYVPNGVERTEWVDPAPLPGQIDDSLRRIRHRGLPIVAYAGAHGLANALDVLLDAAKLLEGIAEIVLVGDGPERDHLARRVANEALQNVTMFPSIPKRAIPAFLAAIDIAYLGLQSQPLFRFGISPNKLMDYMMAAKPIVMAIDAGNDPVGEAKCGITVPPGNPSAIRDAVAELAVKTKELRDELGLNGRKFVIERHSYEVLARQFLDACRTTSAA